MKLRLRSIETKETIRIELPTPCSLQQLKQILSQRFASSSSASIHLSLNRKEELLSSSSEETLQSLGVISGDLVFFSVNPNSFSCQSLALRFNAFQIPMSEQPHNSQGSPTLDPDSQICTQKEDILNFNSQKEEGGGLNLNTQKGEASNVDTQEEEVLKLNDQHEDTVDLDTQMGETVDSMEVDDDGSVIDIGKSFSVPGFLRKVFIEELGDDGGNHHKLLVIAVHAVLLESGFVGFDPVSNLVINGFQFPEEWPSAAFKMSLWYTLPEIIGHDSVKGDGINTVVLKFQSIGKFFNVYGSLSTGSGTHWVRVNEDRLVPFLNVIWANCGPVTETIGNDGAFSTSPEREVFAFWRTVKDRLALPLLIDLCEKAGLDLPPCFMRLPTDLKLQILMCLPGIDVAKVACVCSELRYLTSSDDLWKQKFVEQFGDAERSEGGSLWKEKFAKALESRKRRRTAVHTSFMRMRRDRRPFPGRFAGPLPGIIGGDYDLFPPGVFNNFWQPDRAYPRLRNLLPHRNLGGLG